jgi:hypothetical protein
VSLRVCAASLFTLLSTEYLPRWSALAGAKERLRLSPVEQAINRASEVYRERASLIRRWGPEALALQHMWDRECRRIREEG